MVHHKILYSYQFLYDYINWCVKFANDSSLLESTRNDLLHKAKQYLFNDKTLLFIIVLTNLYIGNCGGMVISCFISFVFILFFKKLYQNHLNRNEM